MIKTIWDQLDDLDRALIEKCKEAVDALDSGAPIYDVWDDADSADAVRLLVRLTSIEAE